MTAATEALPKHYDGNGVTTSFPVTWAPVRNVAEVRAGYEDAGVFSEKINGSEFTVTGNAETGWNVVFSTPPPVGTKNVIIWPWRAAIQDIPFADLRRFPGENTENMGDKLAEAVQDIKASLRGMFQLSMADWDKLGPLPPLSTAVGKFFTFVDDPANPGKYLVSFSPSVAAVEATAAIAAEIQQVAAISGSVVILAQPGVVSDIGNLAPIWQEMQALGQASTIAAMLAINGDISGNQYIFTVGANLDKGPTSEVLAVGADLIQVNSVVGAVGIDLLLGVNSTVKAVGEELLNGPGNAIEAAAAAPAITTADKNAAEAARIAADAARDLAEAWASQPVDEDVAGANPGDRSALHQASKAADSALEALTAEIASKTYQLGEKANVSAAATDPAAVAGRSIFFDLSDSTTKLLTSISPATADPLATVTASQLSQLENFNIDTLAALIARPDADLIAGSTVAIKYGSAFGGYGDAEFYVLSGSAASNGLTADGVVVLQSTEGGRTLVRKRWKDEGIVDLLWYTPAMDGGSASTAALTAFFTRINALAAAQGRIRGVIPAVGVPFLSAATQVIDSGVKLTGGGTLKAHSTLAMPAALLQTATLAGTTGVYEQSDIILDDIVFDGGNNAFSYANRRALVRMFSIDDLLVRNCRFADHDYIQLSVGGCRNPRVEANEFEAWGYPTQQNDGGSAIWTAENPDVTDATETTQLSILNNVFKNGDWSAMQVLNSGGIVADNKIYNVKEAGIYAQDDGTSNSERLTIAKNLVDGVTVMDLQAAGFELSSAGMLVEGNWILNCVGPGIDLTGNSKDAIVRNNTLAGNAAGNATLDTTFGSSNYGQLTIRLNPTGPVIPENVVIEDNNIGLKNVSPTADYAISVLRAPASGSDAIANLKIRDNDCLDGFTSAAVFVASGILGAGSQVVGNEGDVSRAARVYKDQIYVRPDSALEAVIGIDQSGAQNAVLELLTATVKRYRLFINSSGRLFERLFDGSGSILSGLTYREVDQTTGQTNWRFGHVFENVVTFQERVDAQDVVVAGGLYRWEGAISDDAFASIPWAGGANFSGKVLVVTQDNTRRSTEFLLHGATPTVTDLSTAGITLLTTKTDLTGTTGVDGAITVSLNAAGDAIHIENRLGGVRTFNLSVLGS